MQSQNLANTLDELFEHESLSADQFTAVGERKCSDCDISQPLDHEHFYIRKSGEYRQQCIACMTAKQAVRNDAKQAEYRKLKEASKNLIGEPVIKLSKKTYKFSNPQLQSMYEFWLTTKPKAV